MSIALGIGLAPMQSVMGLPPPQDPPEEIQRTEIILDGRSPIDGQPLSAQEYVLLQEQLGTSPYPPEINHQAQQLLQLLRLRKLIRTFIPF